MNPDNSLAQNRVIPALRRAQDKLTYGQAGIQIIKTISREAGQHRGFGRFEGCLSLLDSRLMKLLAIRLSWQTSPAKSLVMRGNDGLMDYLE